MKIAHKKRKLPPRPLAMKTKPL